MKVTCSDEIARNGGEWEMRCIYIITILALCTGCVKQVETANVPDESVPNESVAHGSHTHDQPPPKVGGGVERPTETVTCDIPKSARLDGRIIEAPGELQGAPYTDRHRELVMLANLERSPFAMAWVRECLGAIPRQDH